MNQDQNVVQEALGVAARMLEAYGFEIVTEDRRLFPQFEPSLAVLKDRRLLVFAASAYSSADLFLRPEELNEIREDLESLIAANQPSKDDRVREVEKIALVVTPGEITMASAEGDIKWLVVETADEVPEEMDRLFSPELRGKIRPT